ncbi:PLP-dependent transferase [Aureobasidium subglaciale]|nr:PLP-dependent transferase [Aureobasidium subglaciale]
MRQVGSVLWPRLRAVQVYGANTGVGKTVVSTLLCKALRKGLPDYNVHYLKPISTGPLDDQDNRPHIAARISKEPIDDQSILSRVYEELLGYATGKDAVAVVETAGGVLSPAPSGNVQADLYRTLRLPALLVGDHRLGGIGTTISSWESLHVRGYDVNSILLFEESRYDNHTYLKDYFKERGVLTLSLPPPPEVNSSSQAEDQKAMQQYYESASESPSLEQCIKHILHTHDQRLASLQALPKRADKSIWHPFMQHTERSEQNIMAIDSAYGDYFQTHNSAGSGSKEGNQLKPAFDGSASWWTQGLGHGNPALALTAAHAAGRYGHVMFAGAAHEPAVSLSETLLQNIGNPRLSKVFFTDNGSTGMEVAVKMALKAASKRYDWSSDEEVLILGLKGSYHGDTIGTMDMSEPSTYNKKVEWYSGRGHWFDFPLVKMKEGKWIVEPPAGMEEEFGATRSFSSLDDIFALSGRKADADRYEAYIKTSLEALTAEGKKFGALIMEPVILGAGGMLFSDPLFQHMLTKVVREQCPELYGKSVATPDDDLSWKGIPVVFDEVFTGLYRLGRFSSSSFVDVQPDISVHAKLLTGGLLPLCTTTASESIFEAFLSPEKSDALLHGHSYTAHAVGCEIARYSLKTMKKMDEGATWTSFKSAWTKEDNAEQKIWSMWSQDFIRDLSLRSNVESVFAIGSVLAISLKDPAGSGYTSTAATGLRDTLLHDSSSENAIHSRVLGNVLYLMASMTTSPETVASIQRKLQAAV